MRIGTLAAAAGLSTKTIRFYEQAGLWLLRLSVLWARL
ncbi:MerR family DNA-binding transcriptional regulator [Nonomuraea insulae]|uniref:MerR family DNA-binding transcriptional regulator n=1 Tax=Nonomuraea insulae TaxID=1616787 RepID=A0ABW1CB91_9ACTN